MYLSRLYSYLKRRNIQGCQIQDRKAKHTFIQQFKDSVEYNILSNKKLNSDIPYERETGSAFR